MQRKLTVDAFAIDIDDVVRRALRDFVNVIPRRLVGDAGVVVWKCTPSILAGGIRVEITQVTIAEPDSCEVRASLAPLIGAGKHDAEGIVGEGLRNDAGNFRRDFGVAVSRRIVDRLGRNAAVEAQPIERTGRLDVDRRADAARRDRSATSLVNLHRCNTLGCEVRKVEGARCRRACAIAQCRGRHLSAVQKDQVIFRAEAANRYGGALAILTIDRNAGNALKRLGEVRIGELANVLGGNCVYHALRVALDVLRGGKAGTNAGNDDGVALNRPVLSVDSGRFVGNYFLSLKQARRDQHSNGGCTTQQTNSRTVSKTNHEILPNHRHRLSSAREMRTFTSLETPICQPALNGSGRPRAGCCIKTATGQKADRDNARLWLSEASRRRASPSLQDEISRSAANPDHSRRWCLMTYEHRSRRPCPKSGCPSFMLCLLGQRSEPASIPG